jgi:hypothetical protein
MVDLGLRVLGFKFGGSVKVNFERILRRLYLGVLVAFVTVGFP